MKRLKPIMLGGTGSDVGKSLIATALCRIFLQDGYHPAPFKAQNMALNSFATPDGGEIGRAQAVQAEAAGLECMTDMNPILLKPSGDRMSQVVLNGKPIGNRDAYSYYHGNGRDMLRDEAHKAFDRLASCYNPIVMEGAGSIAELNLKKTDLVNISMARYADAAVILVGDIDRGGVFASLYGSIMLQTPEDRKLIRGIIINKFRGDMRLFESGRKMIEDICGVPVLGVLPYMNDINIEAEDSVSLSGMNSAARDGAINVAVVKLPHISNFTDFDRLASCEGVNLYFTFMPEEIEKADIVILPGTKSTIADLTAVRNGGIEKAILNARRRGKTILGICGGYQMLGTEIHDPDNIEGGLNNINGLCLLPVTTTMARIKITERKKFHMVGCNKEMEGYEIHQGRTEIADGGVKPMIYYSEGGTDGCIVDEHCMGTYMHGVLDHDDVINLLLVPYRDNALPSIVTDYKTQKESQYNMLADKVRECLDMDKLYEIMGGK